MWVVYHLHRKIGSSTIFGNGKIKMCDGKFRSNWPFNIRSKNSNLTLAQPGHDFKLALSMFHNKDIR